MSETSIMLTTCPYTGEMHESGVGTTKLDVDVVNGIRMTGRKDLIFTHFLFDAPGDELHKLSLPQDQAERIYDFSEQTYVHGKGEFDCHGFLGYVLGWETDINAGARRDFFGTFVETSESESGVPY